MSKNYRLGLDLGTNSLGWSVWELSDQPAASSKTRELQQLLDAGVRIFSDGRDQKKTSLAVARRQARGMRRRRRRLNRRKLGLVRDLRAQGLLPEPSGASRRSVDHTDPYELRYRALQQELTPYQLGRVLFHLGQRRGYKSNAKMLAESSQETTDQASEETEERKEEKKNLESIGKLQERLQQEESLGVWLYKRCAGKQKVRFHRPKGDTQKMAIQGNPSDISIFYPSRKMYQDEFWLIQARQSQYPAFQQLDWENLYQRIFYQRPLKRPERGYCWYYEDQKRAYKAQASSQLFRIAQDLLNLRGRCEDGTVKTLSSTEFESLYQALSRQKDMSFAEMRKKLGWPKTRTFNLERNRRSLKGAAIAVDMRGEEYFGARWQRLSLEQQDGYLEQIMHFMYAASDAELEQQVEPFRQLGLSEQQCQNLVKYTLPSGTTSISAVFQRELLPRLLRLRQEKPCDGVASLLYEYRQQNSTRNEELERLSYYGQAMPESCYPVVRNPDINLDPDERKYGRIANPTVHVALRQLQKVVNGLIGKYGKPAEIVIELGRDLKNSRKTRAEIEKRQKENETRNRRYDEELKEEGIKHPSRDMRRKLALYEELMKGSTHAKCPYCGNNICAEELFSSDNRVELEHILPYSRSLDNSMTNLTLSHTACNRQKGNSSPHEAFSSDPQRWRQIQMAIEHLPKDKKRRFGAQAMQQLEENEQFLARQLTDNAYIARKAMQYLEQICSRDRIWANNGSVTELLRDSWNLDSLLHEEDGKKGKNREDHRHHALDAIVIAMVDRSLLHKITKVHMQHSNYEQQREAKKSLAGERPKLREQVAEVLQQIVVSHKQDHSHNRALFDQTANGKIYKALAVKNAQELWKYLPFLVSQSQTDFVLDFIANQLDLLCPIQEGAGAKAKQKVEEKRQELEQLLERLCQLAGSLRPPKKEAKWESLDSQLSSQDYELLKKAGRIFKKLWEEAFCAYQLEQEEMVAKGKQRQELRYWREYFVNSKPLANIKEDDCKPLAESHKGPASESLRRELLQAWKEAKDRQKWPEFLRDFGQHRNIKRVRYIPKDQTLVRPKQDQPQFYMPDGVAYCVIWQVPEKSGYRYSGDFVSYLDALQGRSDPPRPHPAAKRLARVYKGDILYSEAQKQYFVIKTLAPSSKRLDVRPVNDARKSKEAENQKGLSTIFSKWQCCPVIINSIGKTRSCWNR